ncbi:MAG: helix-turn-helix transcriptional regulator [Clostridia bacterium]|nr:helix-turn-helix transcriptional regulator [Clostridia bacterium]
MFCRFADPAVLQRRSWPAVEACYSRTWTAYRMTPHCHQQAEIMYVLKGKCRIHLYATSAGAQQTIRLSVGEFIFIDAGVVHALEVEESSYMVNAEFSIHADEISMLSLSTLYQASEAMRWWLDARRAFLCGVDSDGALHAALSTIVDNFTRLREDEKPLQDVRMGQLLLACAQSLHAANTAASSLIYIRQAVQILTERLDETIRVEDLARQIGISASYLQKLFHQVQGMTIIDCLNRLRIERSKLLLTRTDDAVIDVAMATGFNSRQHFTRVFTSIEGQSPQQYRKAMKERQRQQMFALG